MPLVTNPITDARLQFGPDMILPTGQILIKAFEDCRLEAYLDSGGKPTIGWGHTGPEVHLGLVWSQLQCDQAFDSDFQLRLNGLSPLLPPLRPGQIAALESLVYNIGIPAFSTSHLLSCLRQGAWTLAANEFLRWDHVGTGESKGLLHRRLAEALIFISAS